LITHQGPIAEVTVAQQLNQGTNPKTGCYRFRGSFFVTFLDKQKSKKKKKFSFFSLERKETKVQGFRKTAKN